MSYSESIFSYRVLALLLMVVDLFPLHLLQCADLLNLQLSLGAVSVCLLALRGYRMRCFAVVDGFSIFLIGVLKISNSVRLHTRAHETKHTYKQYT